MSWRYRLCWLLLVGQLSDAYIYDYKNTRLGLGRLEYRRIGMFTAKDAPYVGPPGNGDSYIDIDVTMRRVGAGAKTTGLIEVLVTHAEDFSRFGFVDNDDNVHYCCTQDLVSQQVAGCNAEKLGRALIGPPSDPSTESTLSVVAEVMWRQDNWDSTVPVVSKYIVPRTGRYYLLFSSCLNATRDVVMDGTIEWMNPYGFLPGELYPCIPMYLALSLAYFVTGLVWGFLVLINRHDILRVQHSVSVAILLCLIEAVVWYVDFSSFNSNGKRSMAPMIAGVIMSSIKRTVCRLMVLIVCMGYGVVLPDLDISRKRKVAALGFVYLVFSSAYDVMTSYSQVQYMVQSVRIFFLFPLAALDSVFFLWILQEITNNLTLLKSRNQPKKAWVFRRLWHILSATAIFSVLWALYQMGTIVFVPEDQRWETLWLFEGMWNLVYYLVLVSIACLWKPSENATAYAYSEQITMDEEDAEDAQSHNLKHLQPAFTVDDDEDDGDDDNDQCDDDRGMVQVDAPSATLHAMEAAQDARRISMSLDREEFDT